MRTSWVTAAVIALLVLLLASSSYYALGASGGKSEGRVLSKVTFIHFRKGNAKPSWAGGGGKEEQGYYTYISKGARWRVPEDFRINLACGENPGGSLNGTITAATRAGMDEWETPADATFTIFGYLLTDPYVSYQGGAYRGSNTISFGNYGNPNVIAVTTVWGYFSGPTSQREIVEAHVLMNDVYEWGDASSDSDGDGSADSYFMDLQNIITHELGHCAGMGDVYQSPAVQETMYGYSAEGELIKRDLYSGDIVGITKLYE